MKKVLVFLVAFASTVSLKAQEISIPQVVSQQLTALFVKATNIKWANPSEQKYEARFDEDGIVKSALFSNSGELLQTLVPISILDFPVDVTNSLLKNFPDFEIYQSVRIEIGREVSFKMRVRKGRDIFEVEIDILGRIKSKIRIGSENEKEYKRGCDDEGEYCERHNKKHKVKHKEKDHPHKHKK